ncbi:MAG: methionine--tRNA ligase [Anaerolineales bacterium]|nr:MAG: methionine--tRNA ligase [Anaerolineales bacterium]
MSEIIHVSVAWPYANGDLHVGHLAGAYLPADIFARYHRLKGNRVLMVSGSDSHGTPITVEADKLGKSPRDVFEHYHHRFLEAQKSVGISYDLYTHTDTENHHRIAQDFFSRLFEKEYLYRQTQQQLYSEDEARFLPDRYVEGTCPRCGFKDARGDQCDNCGSLLDALELINPRSKTDGSTPVVRETEHFFLDLPAFTDRLLAYLEAQGATWRPNVINFARNFIEGGLKGRAVTRDVEWGVPVPLDGWDSKRLYVWFEAVMGYFTASVEWAKNIDQPDAWKEWWYNPQAKIYNFIGKDNIPFHTVIWQAELLGVGSIYDEPENRPLNLPYDVPANEFMNIEGAQFSKSRNWAVWVPDILERYQPDAIRFYVAAAMPEARDSDFSWSEFVRRNNDELVAAWGNLANRVLSFAYKNWEGHVPEPGELRPDDRALLEKIEAGFDSVGSKLGDVKLRAALNEALALTREVNAYLDQAPWFGVIKVDRQSAATTVYTALRAIDSLKILFAPFLPFSSEKLHQTLGYQDHLFGEQHIKTYTESQRSHEALIYDASQARGRWEPSQLPPNQALLEPHPVFQKLDEDLIEVERSKLGQPHA